MIVFKAIYQPASVPSHRNNPLIEALPNYLEWRPRDVLAKIASRPKPVNELATRVQNTSWLNELPTNLFVATKRHYALFETIDLLIRQGYVLRNPITPERAEYMRDAYARMQAGERVTEGTFETEAHEQLTASLIGASGLGKTRTINRILSLYPQVLEHEREFAGGPFLQIVYIKVNCPHDGSVNALCREILSQIASLTGIDYASKFRITDRTTLETLKSTLVHLLAVHYVGIIVIDEIQNLVSSRKNREDLFNFIVSLSNSINVPLLFVGTPRIHRLMTNNVCLTRRFGTRGFICWQPLKKDSKEWKSMISALWDCNRLRRSADEMPEALQDKFYERSGGITVMLVTLYVLTQIRLLLLSSRKGVQGRQEMTPEAVDSVFDEYFSNMKPVIDRICSGDASALLEYEDISMPNIDKINEIIADMSEKIGSEGEDFNEDELRRMNVEESVRGGLAYAGDGLPPVAGAIGAGILDDAKGQTAT